MDFCTWDQLPKYQLEMGWQKADILNFDGIGWLDCLPRLSRRNEFQVTWIQLLQSGEVWSVSSVVRFDATGLLMQIIYQNVIIRNSEESTEGIKMTLIFIMTDEADSFAAKMGRSDALQSAISVFEKNESCHWCRPFFASGVVCSKYTRRTRRDCKFWTRQGKNIGGACHARVISTQIHYIPGTTSPIRRWSTSQLKIVWKKHENMFRTKRHKRALSLALEFLGLFDTSPAIQLACCLDNLMVDLIESSGGATSCPEGLRSRFCKEGHITHSLARDPPSGIPRWCQKKSGRKRNTNTNHAVELERRKYWEAYWKCSSCGSVAFMVQRGLKRCIVRTVGSDCTVWQHENTRSYPHSWWCLTHQTWGIRKTS